MAQESKRSERARQTRMRMLQAALDLFVEHGYGATTLQDVASRAGVAVQTIYFTFGNKRTLLKELADVSIAGDDEPIATMDRPWFKNALAAETAEEQLRAHVRGSRKVLERVAPVLEVIRGAMATDPEIGRWPGDVDLRYVVMSAAGKALATKPGLRDDVDEELAADVLYAMLSPELYQLCVRDRGWTPRKWERWTTHALIAHLCAG